MKPRFIGVLLCMAGLAMFNHGFAEPSCGRENTKTVHPDFNDTDSVFEITVMNDFDSVYTIENQKEYFPVVTLENEISVNLIESDSVEFCRSRYTGDVNLHHIRKNPFHKFSGKSIYRYSQTKPIHIRPMYLEPPKIPSNN